MHVSQSKRVAPFFVKILCAKVLMGGWKSGTTSDNDDVGAAEYFTFDSSCRGRFDHVCT